MAGELHGVSAGHVIDHLLLHVAVGCFYIGALVVVLGGSIDLVGGVTHPVLPSEAPLHLVSLLQCLLVVGLHHGQCCCHVFCILTLQTWSLFIQSFTLSMSNAGTYSRQISPFSHTGNTVIMPCDEFRS